MAVVALYFAVNAFHPLGPGVVLQGIVIGGLNSLIAMGLVLIYRSARIINFSQQVIGAPGRHGRGAAGVVGRASTYWIAVPIGLAVAVFTGWLVEFAVIQRFVTAPRLILTVVTIGVYQLVGAAALGLPKLFTLGGQRPDDPEDPVRAGPVHRSPPTPFYGDDFVALGVIAVVLVGPLLVLRPHRLRGGHPGGGRLPRAGGAPGHPGPEPQPHHLDGGGRPVGRRGHPPGPKTIGGFSIGQVDTPATLLLPLAAAMLAGMESFPLTVAWSVVLGVVDEVVYSVRLQSAYVDVAQFLVIIVGVFLIRRRSDPTRQHRRVRRHPRGGPHPAPPGELKEVKIARGTLATVVLAVVVLVPLLFNSSKQLLAANVAIYALIGVSIVVLTGWAGQISLGQFAFVGVGVGDRRRAHRPPARQLPRGRAGRRGGGRGGGGGHRHPGPADPRAVPGGGHPGLRGAVQSYVLSATFFPSLNPAVVPPPSSSSGSTSGPRGPSTRSAWSSSWCGDAGGPQPAQGPDRTEHHRRARQPPGRVRAYGISPLRTKLLAFIISGAIAGVAGSLYVVGLQGCRSDGLPADLSITVFVMVVIGGLGSITGAVLGAVYVQSVQYFLPADLQLLATGAGLLILLLFIPEGLGGVLFRIRDWSLVKLEAYHFKRTAVATPDVGGVGRRPVVGPELAAVARTRRPCGSGAAGGPGARPGRRPPPVARRPTPARRAGRRHWSSCGPSTPATPTGRWCSTTWRSGSARARWWRSSAPTVPGRPPCCGRWRGSCVPPRAVVSFIGKDIDA